MGGEQAESGGMGVSTGTDSSVGGEIAGIPTGAVQVGVGKIDAMPLEAVRAGLVQAGSTESVSSQVGEAKVASPQTPELRTMIREVIEDFLKTAKAQADESKDAVLMEERMRRESLEQRVNELIADNEKARLRAEASERSAAIKAELQRAGVTKLELAYKAVQDEIYRSEDGRLVGQGGSELREHIARFVGENPELLPARLAGGSGASAGQRSSLGNLPGSGGVDLDKIRPGMNPEELERVRQEIARVASQTLRGW